MGKLNIGIVGLNFGREIIARELITGPAQPYFELAAVCDLVVGKADQAAKQYRVKAYYDIDSLLTDPNIPVIGLYAGPVGRAALIRRIIRAGKDVMTAKPFETDPDAALDVLIEARRLGMVVHLNSPSSLFTDDLQQIQDWRNEYNLGRPIACRADTWGSYREKPDGSWYDDPDQCPVAPIFRIGIYTINDIVRFFGEPEAVQVMHSRILTERPTPDNAQLNIRFKNGAIASVFASLCVDDREFWKASLVMNFESGTVYRNAGPVSDGASRSDMAVVYRVGEKEKGVERVRLEGRSGEYQWEIFHRAVAGEKLEGEVTLEEIVAGLRVIRTMRRTQVSGKTEAISQRLAGEVP